MTDQSDDVDGYGGPERRAAGSDDDKVRRAARALPFFVKVLVWVTAVLVVGQVAEGWIIGHQQATLGNQQSTLAAQQQTIKDQQAALSREVGRVDVLAHQNAALTKALAEEAIARTTENCETLNGIKDTIAAYIRGLASGGNTTVSTDGLAAFPPVKQFIDQSRAASRAYSARALMAAIETFKHKDCTHANDTTTTTVRVP